MSESLAASLPATVAFQPRNLQTFFSPSKQDVDLAYVLRNIEDFTQVTNEVKEKNFEIEQKFKHENAELKQEIVQLKQENTELKLEIVGLKEGCRRYQSSATDENSRIVSP